MFLGTTQMEDRPPPVFTKKDFTLRYQAGEFGNRTQTWHSLEDFYNPNRTKRYHLRNRIAGGATYYDQTVTDVRQLWSMMKSPEMWYCSEMAPTSKTLFQGEVFRSDQGLALYYSTIPKPMRDSLKEGGQQVIGLTAKLFLEHYLDPVDYDWLNELLDRYDGHVVEFSHYNVACGVLNRRLIVWEVRNY